MSIPEQQLEKTLELTPIPKVMEHGKRLINFLLRIYQHKWKRTHPTFLLPILNEIIIYDKKPRKRGRLRRVPTYGGLLLALNFSIASN